MTDNVLALVGPGGGLTASDSIGVVWAGESLKEAHPQPLRASTAVPGRLADVEFIMVALFRRPQL